MDQNDEDNKEIDLNDELEDLDTGVELEEYRAPRSYDSRIPKIVQWVIKYSGGLVKNERQANYALICFMVIVLIVISLVLVFGNGSEVAPPSPIP